MRVGKSGWDAGAHIGPSLECGAPFPHPNGILPDALTKTLVMWEPIQDPCLGRGRRFPHRLRESGHSPGPGLAAPGLGPGPLPDPCKGCGNRLALPKQESCIGSHITRVFLMSLGRSRWVWELSPTSQPESYMGSHIATRPCSQNATCLRRLRTW